MILQLKYPALIRILVLLVVLVQPSWSKDCTVDVNTYVTAVDIVDNMNESFEKFRETVKEPASTNMDIMFANFLLETFNIPEKNTGDNTTPSQEFKHNFIKATYTVYLSTLYAHSFMKCWLYDLAGPELEGLYPIDKETLSKCRSVLVFLLQPLYTYLKTINNDQIKYFSDFYSGRTTYVFVDAMIALKKYIRILLESENYLEENSPTELSKSDAPVQSAYAKAHNSLLDKNNEELQSIREYLRMYFNRIDIDEGPINLEGNFVQPGKVDIKSERVKTTAEMFIWRNGAQILEKHEEALEETASNNSKNIATQKFATMHPFKFLRICEEFRYGIFEIWQSKGGMVEPLPQPHAADYSRIDVIWNRDDKTKPDFEFNIKKYHFFD